VIASFMAIAFNIVIITLTIEHFQHLAIALSTSCTMLLNLSFLIIVLHKKISLFSLKKTLMPAVKIISASIVMIFFLLLLVPVFQGLLNGNKFNQIISVFSLIFLAALSYGSILYLLKLQEMEILINTFRKKFSRSN